MTADRSTPCCPRCFAPLPAPADARYCPRCGLPDVRRAAADTAPIDVAVRGRTYRVSDRIAVGSRCVVYRCHFTDPQDQQVEGTFKLARETVSNAAVAREAEVLQRLHGVDYAGQFAPFLPVVVETSGYVAAPGEPPRHANVLRLHPDVRSPADDLYTLAEVRAAYPDGVDARDMAWVWRRLLTVLGFAHDNGIAHGGVVPPHVLIDPADHKLVVISWCDAHWPGAVRDGTALAVPGPYRAWIGAERHATPAGDVRLAARCMVDLVGGDAARDAYPATVDPAIRRHLSRCASATTAYAWQLRVEFDQLIEALWGPRQFRPLAMPPRRHSV